MDLLRSFFDIYKYVFFTSKKDVIFYYPQHFNRSTNGQNPYFQPLMEACVKNGITYLLVEEPDNGSSAPRNKNAIYFDCFLWVIIGIRKFCRLFNTGLKTQEKWSALIINIITFNKFKTKRYVTISGSMLHFFAALNRNGTVFDLQHGIINSKQPGYFDQNSQIKECHKNDTNVHFLLFGEGFKNMFFQQEENKKNIENRVHVVGYPLSKKRIEKRLIGKAILISPQMLVDLPHEHNMEQKRLIYEFMECCERVSGNQKFYIKQHPRFNRAIGMSDLFTRFPGLEDTTEEVSQIAQKIFLHVTFFSTTAFEYSSYGIPTYFLSSAMIPQGLSIFYDEFHYPLFRNQSLDEILDQLNDPNTQKDSNAKVTQWYHRFYSDFDESEFIELMQK